LATVRFLSIVFLVIAACGGGQILNLRLAWRDADDTPIPSDLVAQSFSAAPLAFGLRDVRPDPSAVGLYEDNGFVVRTRDNVAQYCGTRMSEMLARAGARLRETPLASLEVELLEYRVIEGGTFNGLVRIRAIVRHNTGEAWARTYVGKSKRWGRTHNPENFNEALSNALADVVAQLLRDDDFAHVLIGAPVVTPLQLQPPVNTAPAGPAGA
jgi:hypothetical protein